MSVQKALVVLGLQSHTAFHLEVAGDWKMDYVPMSRQSIALSVPYY